jgi:hypothetical protein
MGFIVRLAALLFCIVVWYSCVNHDLYERQADLQIALRWTKNYEGETLQDVITGFAWNTSFLGAALPKGSLQSAIKVIDAERLAVDFGRLGFNKEAEQSLVELFNHIRASEEYKATGGIDIGRFTMLTLNSTYHYYSITGASTTLDVYQSKFLFDPNIGAVTNSSIAKGHRKVMIGIGDRIQDIVFIAEEGKGSITDGSFVAEEFETLDVMPNGQLRFALYDKDGRLKTSASQELTNAGKPAKCLWCHEINLQSFNEMQSVVGYFDETQLRTILSEKRKIIDAYRRKLNSDLDFSKTQDHTKGELLYISFMEPSVERLVLEWKESEEVVRSKTQHLSKHKHEEFSFLGDELMRRADIDLLSPWQVIQVPEDAREPSRYEPQILFPL